MEVKNDAKRIHSDISRNIEVNEGAIDSLVITVIDSKLQLTATTNTQAQGLNNDQITG